MRSTLLASIENVVQDEERKVMSTSQTRGRDPLSVPCAFRALASACRDEAVTRAAIGVLGDLADAMGHAGAHLFAGHKHYIEFVNECLQSKDERVRETAAWTHGKIVAATAEGSGGI